MSGALCNFFNVYNMYVRTYVPTNGRHPAFNYFLQWLSFPIREGLCVFVTAWSPIKQVSAFPCLTA